MNVRETVDSYAAIFLIGFAIVGGWFWSVLGAVLAFAIAAAVCLIAWHCARYLGRRLMRWRLKHDVRGRLRAAARSATNDSPSVGGYLS